MAYEDYQPQVGALGQASTDPNAQIQQLLQKEYLRRVQALGDPQQDARRQSALESVQSALRGNPAGTYTPTEHSLATTVGAIGRMNPTAGISLGAQAGSDMSRQLEAAKFKNRVAAENLGYEDIKSADKNDIGELAALGRAIGSTSRKAGDLNARELSAARMMFTSAMNDLKDSDYGSTEEKMRVALASAAKTMNVEPESLRAILMPSFAAGAKPTAAPAVAMSGEPQAAPAKPMPEAVETGAKQKDGYPKVSASEQFKRDTERLHVLKQEELRPEVRADLAGYSALLREIKDTEARLADGVQPQATQQPATTASAQPVTKPKESTGGIGEYVANSGFGPALMLEDKTARVPEGTPGAPQRFVGDRRKEADRINADARKEIENFKGSEQYKQLDKTQAQYEALRNVAEVAYANPENTNALTGVKQQLTKLADAMGVPMDAESRKSIANVQEIMQAGKMLALVEQLAQHGTSTDKDFVNIVKSAFDENMSIGARKRAARSYLDKANEYQTKKVFIDKALGHPNAPGNINTILGKWEDFKMSSDGATTPSSVLITGQHGPVPFHEAVKLYYAHSPSGKQNKPDPGDSPAILAEKWSRTVKSIQATDRKNRAQAQTEGR